MMYRQISLFLLINFFIFMPQAMAQDSTLIAALKQAKSGNKAPLYQLEAQGSLEGSIAQWVRLRDRGGQFEELENFVTRHPDWPGLGSLKDKAETAMPDTLPREKILAWFGKYKPDTARGASLYLNALNQSGQQSAARQFAQTFWHESNMSRTDQQNFYQSFQAYLGASDHQKRLATLLNRGNEDNALAVAGLLGAEWQALARARLALQNNSAEVESKLAAVPAALQSNAGLLYDRLVWRRKKDMNSGMEDILSRAPSAQEMQDPTAWWKERQILTRRYLEDKNYARAYQIAAGHKQREGLPFAQAEWLAGWIALRFLNQPYRAFQHFEAMYKSVKTPISLSRGAYWAGRASEALQQNQVAAQWYAIAAQYPETFYGQLASGKLAGRGHISFSAAPPVAASSSLNDQRARAAKIFHQVGYREESRLFLFRMLEDAKSQGDYLSVARLAKELGYLDITIKAAQDIRNNYNILYADYLYPVNVSAVQGQRRVEWALIHALIRQESRFDQTAVSPAGARGLMQLMPATAKETAREIGLPHDTSWLTTRSDHNIALGARYMEKLLRRFEGDYAMAAAGYNAGPNRLPNWVAENGDPRRGAVDLIDWIEMIPIYETRNYVQRVLEGVYVYRQLLDGVQPAPQYVSDIHMVSAR